MLTNKRIVVTGATGSLGCVLVKRILSGELGNPKSVVVFSRDEAKQHEMRMSYQNRKVATDEVVYGNFRRALQFWLGDVRDYESVCSVLKDVDVCVHASAMKQVPACEYQPYEAVMTNVIGAANICRAIRDNDLPVQTLVGISSDKACLPINVYGQTKAIAEKVFITANLYNPWTRYVCVRYGNVLASRGSVIPLFHDQIKMGGPLTITTPEMTRFQISLDQAVDTIFAALKYANRAEIYVPKLPTIRIVDLAEVLINGRPIKIEYIGIRPGEKIHEIMVSQEEAFRTIERDGYLVVLPVLPELSGIVPKEHLDKEVSSADNLISKDELRQLLKKNKLMVEDGAIFDVLGATFEHIHRNT